MSGFRADGSWAAEARPELHAPVGKLAPVSIEGGVTGASYSRPPPTTLTPVTGVQLELTGVGPSWLASVSRPRQPCVAAARGGPTLTAPRPLLRLPRWHRGGTHPRDPRIRMLSRPRRGSKDRVSSPRRRADGRTI